MDDPLPDLTELENELRALRPAALGHGLTLRVERALAEPLTAPIRPQNQPAFAWLAWPIAACFVSAVAWLSHGPHSTSDRASHPSADSAPMAATFKPVDTENILYDVREEGLTTLPDGTPARQVRDRYMDVITWKNAAATSSVCWTVPRDEVRLVPIEAY